MKTRLELKNMVIRECKVGNDSTALAGIDTDLEIANGIVANKRAWAQLIKTATLSLTSSDGDISYPLASDVDEVNQLLITSPASYARMIYPVQKELLREEIPNKLIPGRAVPSRWYFSEPTLSALNVETKNVSFDYRPEQDYTITYSYKSFAPALDADTKYPFFDGQYHHGLMYYAAWKFSERSGDPSNNPIYWRGELDQFIADIEADEQSQTKYPFQIPYDCY